MSEHELSIAQRLEAAIGILESLEKKLEIASTPKFIGRSEQINELAGALSKAQGEMRIAGLESENPYFKTKYADLATIVKASRPALAKHGLSVSQQIMVHEDGQSIMHTILMHASGQWVESRMRVVPAKNDVQSLGSCITYLRRYSYAALVGVTSSGEDDDGEVAMGPARIAAEKAGPPVGKYDVKQESAETISKDQLAELEYELADYPQIAEQVLDTFKIQALADLPKSRYRSVVERVRSIKAARASAG